MGEYKINAQDKREYRAVRKRDNGCCILCGHNVTEIHHIVFRSHGGRNIRQNMVCLCKRHHELTHSDERVWREILLNRMRQHYGMIDVKSLKKQNKWKEVFE